MRHEQLLISNLATAEQVEQVKEIVCGMTGAVFVQADLPEQTIDFDLAQDLDDLTLSDVQCRLHEAGFDAGEVIEGQTCRLRFTSP